MRNVLNFIRGIFGSKENKENRGTVVPIAVPASKTIVGIERVTISLEDGEEIVKHKNFILSVYRDGTRYNMMAGMVNIGDEIGFVDASENVFKFKVISVSRNYR